MGSACIKIPMLMGSARIKIPMLMGIAGIEIPMLMGSACMKIPIYGNALIATLWTTDVPVLMLHQPVSAALGLDRHSLILFYYIHVVFLYNNHVYLFNCSSSCYDCVNWGEIRHTFVSNHHKYYKQIHIQNRQPMSKFCRFTRYNFVECDSSNAYYSLRHTKSEGKVHYMTFIFNNATIAVWF